MYVVRTAKVNHNQYVGVNEDAALTLVAGKNCNLRDLPCNKNAR